MSVLKHSYEPVHKVASIYTGRAPALIPRPESWTLQEDANDRFLNADPSLTDKALAGYVLVSAATEEVKLVAPDTGRVLGSVDTNDSDVVTAFAASSDGEKLLVFALSLQGFIFSLAVEEGEIKGTLEHQWKPHDQPVLSAAFDASNTLVATGSADRSIRVWDVDRKYCTHLFKGHKGLVTNLVWLPPPMGPLVLASGCDAGNIRLWDLSSKSVLASLDNHYSAITSLSVNPSGTVLVSGGRDSVLTAWSLTTHQAIATVPTTDDMVTGSTVLTEKELPKAAAKVVAQHFEPQAQERTYVLASTQSGSLKIWCLEEAALLWSGPLLAPMAPGSLADDETVSKPRPREVSHLVRFPPARSGPKVGSLVLAVTEDLVLNVCGGADFGLRKRLLGLLDEVIEARWMNEEGTRVMVATHTDMIRMLDLTTGHMEQLAGHGGLVMSLDMSPDGRTVVSSSKDGTVRLWDVNTARELGVGRGHVGAVGVVSWACQSNTSWASAAADKTLKIWTLTGDQLDALREPSSGVERKISATVTVKAADKDVNALSWSPNDRLIAGACADKTVKLWASDSGKLQGTLTGHRRGVWAVTFSPVDQVVVSGSADRTIKLWSVVDHTCLRTLEGHTASILRLAVVSAGMQIVSTGSDGLLKLWTIRTSECVNTWEGGDDKVWALDCLPTSETLLTGGGDSELIVWEDTTAAEDEAATAAQEAFALAEQELVNALRTKNWSRALSLALGLDQPRRLYSVLEEIWFGGAASGARGGELGGESDAEELVGKWIADHAVGEPLKKLLGWIREWNTNARHAPIAQLALGAVLKIHSVDRLRQELGAGPLREIVQGLIPYTQRHFDRVDRLRLSSHVVQYTLDTRSALGVGGVIGAGMDEAPTYEYDPMDLVVLERTLEKEAMERDTRGITAAAIKAETLDHGVISVTNDPPGAVKRTAKQVLEERAKKKKKKTRH